MKDKDKRAPLSPRTGININRIGEGGIPAPAFDDPPVPNRAWTEMKLGKDIDELSEEEKADLYLGRDNYF